MHDVQIDVGTVYNIKHPTLALDCIAQGHGGKPAVGDVLLVECRECLVGKGVEPGCRKPGKVHRRRDEAGTLDCEELPEGKRQKIEDYLARRQRFRKMVFKVECA